MQDLEQLVQNHLQHMFALAAQAAQAEGTERMLQILHASPPEEAVCLNLIHDHLDRILNGVRTGLAGLQQFVLEQVTTKYVPRLHAEAPRTAAEEEFVNSVLHLLLTHFGLEYTDEQQARLRQAVKEAGFREPPGAAVWCPVCDIGEGEGDPCDFYCAPCGHPLCSACYPQLRQLDAQRHRLCPSCRAPILAHVRIPGTPLRAAPDDAGAGGAARGAPTPEQQWQRQLEELAARGFALDPLQLLPQLFRFNGNTDHIVQLWA